MLCTRIVNSPRSQFLNTKKAELSSLLAKKIKINPISFTKKQPLRMKIELKQGKKIVPVPRVDYISGWEA